MGHFVHFLSSSNIYAIKTVCFSGIQTRIVRVRRQAAYQLTTITTLKRDFKNCSGNDDGDDDGDDDVTYSRSPSTKFKTYLF